MSPGAVSLIIIGSALVAVIVTILALRPKQPGQLTPEQADEIKERFDTLKKQEETPSGASYIEKLPPKDVLRALNEEDS